jgi:succinate-semialdehyde dehydrogenase/glutarate-semialdehyde dehydrogenase
MYLDGTWCSASNGAQLDVVDPASERVIATVPDATDDDVDVALAAAAAGFRTWRRVSAWDRSAKLREMGRLIEAEADRFATVLTAEQGKPLGQARAEILATAEQFDWYADEARRIYGRVVDAHTTDTRILVRREPVGPVAAFAAWNFPSYLPARKLAPALAAGCSVILVPASEAPLSGLLLAEVADRVGIPPGVVNAVTGDPARISTRLLASDVIRKVSLTGSVPVGVTLLKLAAEGVKSVSMELGGHAPVLVFPDADLTAAARVAVSGKFRNGGQVCISASRFLVHESVADEFTEHFVAATRELRLGPGFDPASDVGPLGSARRRAAVEAMVADAVGLGASVAAGGGRPADFASGYFFEPTVLTGVTADMAVMSEEPFGPVAPITTFGSFDEGIAIANSTRYGLAGFVFTRDLATAFHAAEELEVGMVGVNQLTIATAEAPFGGVKASGFGREGGSEGIDGYTVTKYMSMLIGEGPA